METGCECGSQFYIYMVTNVKMSLLARIILEIRINGVLLYLGKSPKDSGNCN